jgi:uncharacterized small protein (DUF1192 family)
MFETPDELRYEVESLTDEVSNLNNLLRIQKEEIERLRAELAAAHGSQLFWLHSGTDSRADCD